MGLLKLFRSDRKAIPPPLITPPSIPAPPAPPTPPSSGLVPSEDLLKLERKWSTKLNGSWGYKNKNMTLQFKNPYDVPPGGEWLVRMDVLATNIPRFMNDGFHWSAADVIPTESYVTLNGSDDTLTARFRSDGWEDTRTYALQDSKGGKEWTAKIKVYGKSPSAVAGFELDKLSLDQLTFCQAWNWNSQLVYYYSRAEPEASVNVLFGKMPLEGWWPWPKAQIDEEARGMKEVESTQKMSNGEPC